MYNLLPHMAMHRKHASIDSLRAETLSLGLKPTAQASLHRSLHVHYTSVLPRVRFVHFSSKRRTLTSSLTQLVLPQNTCHCLPLFSRKSNAFALHNSCHYLPFATFFSHAQKKRLCGGRLIIHRWQDVKLLWSCQVRHRTP